MDEYLICIHLFDEPSLENLSEATHGDSVGMLMYAVQVAGPTYREMQEILCQNRIEAISGREASYPGFDLHPFIQRVEIDEGFIRYYASELCFFSLDAASQLWGRVEIAQAKRKFDDWLNSSDAALDTPTNRECNALRRCMKEAKLVGESATQQKSPKKAVEYTPRSDDEIKRDIADRQLAYDAAADILIEATLGGKAIPSSSKIAELVIQKGILDISEKTLRNKLSDNQAWKSLMIQAKKRPDREEGREYREWRERFEKALPFLRRELIQRSDAGMSDEERSVSLKKLARLAEKKKEAREKKIAEARERGEKVPKAVEEEAEEEEIIRVSFAVSLFDGELGYSTKSGFVRIPYDDMIAWAKKQGSRYKRLYTPRSPYRFKDKRRKTKRSLCGRLRLKSQCRCHIIIRDENGVVQRPLLPTKREVRLWKRSEKARKARKRKVGLRPCPPCPESVGFCPLFPVPVDMETLRAQAQRAMESGTKQGARITPDSWAFEVLEPEHFELDLTQPDFAALCGWFDEARDTNAIFQATDQEPDVPLLPPDEPYTEYLPDDFFREFGFEMENG